MFTGTGISVACAAESESDGVEGAADEWLGGVCGRRSQQDSQDQSHRGALCG